MNKPIVYSIMSISAVAVIALVLFSMYASYNNQEVSLRKSIEAKQKDNENVYDNMWKSIREIGSIPDRERETAIQLFTEYADARTSDGQGKLMAWVQESIPTANPELYKNLMNTITALRSEFRSNQTRLIDLSREREALINKIPSKWFISNNEAIELTIVTSTRTSRVFEDGKDDEIFEIAPKPKQVEE